MMHVIFSKLATQEFEDAVNYDELEFSGLGERFREEIKRAVELIAEHPESWSI